MGSKQPVVHSTGQEEAQLHGPSQRPLAARAGWVQPEHVQTARTTRSRAVTAAEHCTWRACHGLNGGELLEPAAEKWSTRLNPWAATPGPTQDGREGGLHWWGGLSGETKEDDV
jgi:hypothetical protein